MFAGIKELLIIVFVLLVLFLVPRMLRKRPSDQPTPQAKGIKPANTGVMRLVLLLSLSWIALAFILLNPFSGRWMPFVAVGMLPIAIGWGIRWVVLGFK